jgi:hypothetical protein
VQTGVLKRFHRVRARAGFRLAQKEITIAASQTIVKGDILKRTTGTGVETYEQAIADPGSDATASSASGGNLEIAYVAASSITTGSGGSEATTGRTSIPAYSIADIELAMRLYNATGSSAEAQDFNRGTQYQFIRYRVTSGEQFYALITTTTNGELVYVERCVGADVADDYGPVWTRVNTLEAIRGD